MDKRKDKIQIRQRSCWYEVFLPGPNDTDRTIQLSLEELESLQSDINALVTDCYVTKEHEEEQHKYFGSIMPPKEER